MLDQGTIVEVFEDPLTRVRKEGNAKIVEHVAELEPGLHQYRVNFVGDDLQTVVVRTIADESKPVAEAAHWVGADPTPSPSPSGEGKPQSHGWSTCVGCGRQIIIGQTGVETKQGNKCTRCARARRSRVIVVVGR
jgi:hypothetical protein